MLRKLESKLEISLHVGMKRTFQPILMYAYYRCLLNNRSKGIVIGAYSIAFSF